jgi:2-dehydro-3-deoxygluconokinase
MPQGPVGVATSAYGADLVRSKGQAYFVPIVANGGASAIEIRRELFAPGSFQLKRLGAAIEQAGLFSVYSAPVEIYGAGGVLDRQLMLEMLGEGTELGAKFLKVSLGHFKDESDLGDLRHLQETAPIPFVVENDQTPQGGRIDSLACFLNACRRSNISLTMTFDMGNWRWTGCDPNEAAERLGSFVSYVHCKGVRNDDGKLRAVPLEANDPVWRELFGKFAKGIFRTIEFPLVGNDLRVVTRRYVEVVGSA